MPKELDELLTDFERQDDTGRKLRGIIAEVPSLKTDLEKAARDDNLVAIRYGDLAGINGVYDYASKTLTLNRALKRGVDEGDADSTIALACVAGHEGSHATRGHISRAHTAQIERDVADVHAQGEGLRDYTAVAKRHVDYILKEEATAEIGGFNAAVAACKRIEGGDFSDTLQSLAQKGPGSLKEGPESVTLGQFQEYVEGVQGKFGTDYRLKGGVQPGDGDLLEPGNKSHLDFMRTHFSDRSFGEDPNKDRYYRHTAVADIVRLAIKDGAQPADIGLDMNALEVRRAGFADKFRNPQGQPVSVDFANVPSAPVLPPQPSQPQPQASPQPSLRLDASEPVEFVGGNSNKRVRERSPESIEGEGQGVKALKPLLNPELLVQAQKFLGSNENQQAIAGKGLAADTDRLAYATAVAAQNKGFPKIEDVRIDGGAIWISSAPRGADYGQNACVGLMSTCAQKTAEEHLANVKESPAPSGLAQGGGQPAQDLAARKNQQM